MQLRKHSNNQLDIYQGENTVPPEVLRELVNIAGIQFNGSYPWDIQVHDNEVYRRILTSGSLGFGEAYMDGMWDAHALDELFSRLLSFGIDEQLNGWVQFKLMLEAIRHRLFNLQTGKRVFHVAETHYDIGNDVFEAMLDPSMSYSCGYWHHASTLEQAQINKMDLICKKLELQPGEHLLEIGCGWGGLAYHAAKNYGVKVFGITVSKQQQQFAQRRCVDLPVKIELMDYREITGKFDKVVSVGMFEHVGPKNYPDYFDIVKDVLMENGLFLLHTIGMYRKSATVDAWINKYIFPNGKLPSAREIASALDNRFILEDWHNFGQDYDRTLMAWWKNFDTAWPQLENKYGKRFYRMWKYYLLCCAGFFRSRQGQLWQIVLSKRSRKYNYHSIR